MFSYSLTFYLNQNVSNISTRHKNRYDDDMLLSSRGKLYFIRKYQLYTVICF